jgi:hypothetical protein
MNKTPLITVAALMTLAGLVGCTSNENTIRREALALKEVAGAGETQVVDIPPDTSVIVIRCVVINSKLNTVAPNKDYVQLAFKPRPTGSDTSETQETPESFHIHEFAPGEMRMELHRWPKKAKDSKETIRIVELYENDKPVKFSEKDPNFIKISTLHKIENPENEPSLIDNCTIGNELRIAGEEEDKDKDKK